MCFEMSLGKYQLKGEMEQQYGKLSVNKCWWQYILCQHTSCLMISLRKHANALGSSKPLSCSMPLTVYFCYNLLINWFRKHKTNLSQWTQICLWRSKGCFFPPKFLKVIMIGSINHKCITFNVFKLECILCGRPLNGFAKTSTLLTLRFQHIFLWLVPHPWRYLKYSCLFSSIC